MAVKQKSQADKSKCLNVYLCHNIQINQPPMSKDLIQSLLQRGNVEINPGPEDVG